MIYIDVSAGFATLTFCMKYLNENSVVKIATGTGVGIQLNKRNDQSIFLLITFRKLVKTTEN